MTVPFFFQTLVTGLSSGMISYMMVAGMSLIISGMNMVNFGQGVFFCPWYISYIYHCRKYWLYTCTYYCPSYCGRFGLVCGEGC